jgi:hypothetical protein
MLPEVRLLLLHLLQQHALLLRDVLRAGRSVTDVSDVRTKAMLIF